MHEHTVARHMLGPHVIGQRVVIRRLLPGEVGPSGGALMTDILGVCTAWADGICEITTAEGRPVQFPVGLIVSGKPVPPRESIRLRVSVAEAEHRALSLWDDLEVAHVGEWVLRSSPEHWGRFPARANSVLAIGDPGMPLPQAASAVVGHYSALGGAALGGAAGTRQAWAQVETGSPIHLGLADLGWGPARPGEGDSLFQIGSLPRVLRALRPASELVVALESTAYATGQVLHLHLLGRAEDGTEITRGQATVSADWVGLHDLWTHPDARGRGVMRSLMAELLDWAASEGATTVYLQTRSDNPEALRLYETAGFLTHHAYRYLAAP